eukprot:gb/GECH01001080.1/.p1 GENE.gb/GECH01001080.1/~~gb/GECH01001080.1/.p1  ORF type:complete len:473 (+),score=123.54 gb/GECH01001080.1/:1-1419(+)
MRGKIIICNQKLNNTTFKHSLKQQQQHRQYFTNSSLRTTSINYSNHRFVNINSQNVSSFLKSNSQFRNNSFLSEFKSIPQNQTTHRMYSSTESLSDSELLEKGDSLLNSGEIKKAFQFFSDAIEKSPEIPILYYRRAQCFLNSKVTKKAIDELSTGLKINEQNNENNNSEGLKTLNSETEKNMRILRSKLLIENNRVRRALPDLEEALASDPENTEYLILRAKASIFLQHFESTIADLNKVEQVLHPQPIPISALFMRTRAEIGLERADDAFQDLERLIERTQRSDPEPFKMRADFSRSQGLYEDALDQYQYIAVEMKEEASAKMRGECYVRRGQIYVDMVDRMEFMEGIDRETADQAIHEFTEALRLNPDEYEAYRDRGFLKYRLKRFESAADDLEEAVERALVPRDKSLLHGHLGEIYEMNLEGREEEAIYHYSMAVNVDPGNDQARDRYVNLFKQFHAGLQLAPETQNK